MKKIREREKKERERYERIRKNMKTKFNTTYNTSIGHLPGSVTAKNNFTGSYTTSNTVSTTSFADTKIQIDGGENGSMRVDVPLIVNGRDVIKELDEMRDSLLLLKRDVDMEAKYPRLKELKDEYAAALEKYKTFDALKDSK